MFVAAVAVVLTGCGSGSGSNATGATTTTTSKATTTTAAPAVVQVGSLKVIVGSATGTSPCEIAAPTPASPGELGTGTGGSTGGDTASVVATEHGPRGMVEQVELTQAQRVELQGQMVLARAAAAKYPTVADALAAGYAQSTVYVPCIGAHYTNTALASSFNPSTPSELLYDGIAPDSKLVGLSYLVWHPNGPPPGFAGDNDHWHQHNANGGLCMRGGLVVGGEADTPAQCAAAGGHKALLVDVWMLHAWVVPGFECSWGVFDGECPELGGRLGGTAWQTPDPSAAASAAAAGG